MKIKDTRATVLTIIRYLLLCIGAFIMLFPFIYMVLSSLKTAYESTAIPRYGSLPLPSGATMNTPGI